eukprot:scaffold32348_cov15-Tisochrysis_lutea.AAC.1
MDAHSRRAFADQGMDGCWCSVHTSSCLITTDALGMLWGCFGSCVHRKREGFEVTLVYESNGASCVTAVLQNSSIDLSPIQADEMAEVREDPWP